MPVVHIHAPKRVLPIDRTVLDAIQRAGVHLDYSMHQIWLQVSEFERPLDVIFVRLELTVSDTIKSAQVKKMCDEIAQVLRDSTALTVEVVRSTFTSIAWLPTPEGLRRYGE